MLVDALVYWFQNPGTVLVVMFAALAAGYGVRLIVKKEN